MSVSWAESLSSPLSPLFSLLSLLSILSALAQVRQRQGRQTKVLAQGKSQALSQAVHNVCNPAQGKARPALRKAGRTRQLPPGKNKCDPLCTGSGEAKTRKPHINPCARQVALGLGPGPSPAWAQAGPGPKPGPGLSWAKP